MIESSGLDPWAINSTGLLDDIRPYVLQLIPNYLIYLV